MTREERNDAIDFFKQIAGKERGTTKYSCLAIEALEQEPCEDAISRQAVLNMQYRIDDSATLSTRDVVNVEDIENLPLVIPQPKTGHWIRELIRNEKGGCIGAKMICSECANDNKHDEYMKYCPNCGTKMQEVEE